MIKNLKGALYRRFAKKEIEKPKTRIGQLLIARRERPSFFVVPSKKVIPIPKDVKKIVYPLLSPYAYASIRKNGELIYHVIEPSLSDKEKAILSKIKEGLIETMNVSLSKAKNEKKAIALLEEQVQKLLYEYDFDLTSSQYLRIMYYIYRDFIGLNEIEPLLRDPSIEDISCDGVGVPIYIVHKSFGSLKTNVIYNDENKLQELIVKLAERCDRYISYAEPLLDGSLPDGTRVQASLAKDVTTHGPTFSIRKFPERPFSPIDMIKLKTVDSEMLAYLWFVVEHGANILITGGTATGKTSFLNTISLFIAPEAKIVSIEDTREIVLVHENWIPNVTRIGFPGTRAGEVTMFELLKESFRQNPNYLIVGEVRGEEANVMFQAMSSGISCISTMHSGSVDKALKRLQTRPISLPASLMETLDLVILMVHAYEKGKSARRVKEVDEIESVTEDKVKTKKAFQWDPRTDRFKHSYKKSHILKKISSEKGISMERIFSEIERRKKFIEWLSIGARDWKEISNYIMLYFHNKERALRLMKIQ